MAAYATQPYVELPISATTTATWYEYTCILFAHKNEVNTLISALQVLSCMGNRLLCPDPRGGVIRKAETRWTIFKVG